jgi:hypothetical protein
MSPLGAGESARCIALAAGLTDHVWDMADVVAMIEESEMLVPAAQSE